MYLPLETFKGSLNKANLFICHKNIKLKLITRKKYEGSGQGSPIEAKSLLALRFLIQYTTWKRHSKSEDGRV